MDYVGLRPHELARRFRAYRDPTSSTGAPQISQRPVEHAIMGAF